MDHTKMHEQLRVLAKRAEITDLADRYLRSLDERRFDDVWARSMFTEDARVEFPAGSRQGLEDIVEITRRAIERFGRTQHLGSNYLIGLDGDRATVTGNAVMTHVRPASPQRLRGDGSGPLLVVGAGIDGIVVPAAGGWRFRQLAFRLSWATGRPTIRPASA